MGYPQFATSLAQRDIGDTVFSRELNERLIPDFVVQLNAVPKLAVQLGSTVMHGYTAFYCV